VRETTCLRSVALPIRPFHFYLLDLHVDTRFFTRAVSPAPLAATTRKCLTLRQRGSGLFSSLSMPTTNTTSTPHTHTHEQNSTNTHDQTSVMQVWHLSFSSLGCVACETAVSAVIKQWPGVAAFTISTEVAPAALCVYYICKTCVCVCVCVCAKCM